MNGSFGFLEASLAARGAWAFLLCVGATACSNTDSATEYSAIEPRVATYSTSGWTVEARPADPFNTAVSLFSQQLNSRPLALRVVGSTVKLGRWTGADWDVTEVVSGTESPIDATAADEDQLYSGILVSGPEERAAAAFVTKSGSFFILLELAENQFQLTPLSSASLLCYDLTLGSGGQVLLSWTHIDEGVKLSTFDSSGAQTVEAITESFACTSLGVDPSAGKIGVVLWAANDAYTAMNTTLAEKSADASWSSRAVASDGRLESENTYIPQLAYRSDGAAILSHVDKNFVLTILEELPDDLFDEYALTAAGQTFTMTGFQRSSSGAVYSAYSVDQASIRLFYTTLTDGTPLLNASLLGGASFPGVYPRVAVGDGGATVSYWDAKGALMAFAPAAIEPDTVDSTTSLGYLLGSKLYSWTEGDQTRVQIFYNEIHEL